MTRLYFAYGSNLNVAAMRRRCPAAKKFGRCTLPDWRMVFDGVADIIPSPGNVVEGAIYTITPECERSLDKYEGFPSLYIKDGFWIKVNRRDGVSVERPVMFYTMQTEAIQPPCEAYYETIRQGYDDWSIPYDTLEAAYRESIESPCFGWSRRNTRSRRATKGRVHRPAAKRSLDSRRDARQQTFL